MAYDDDDGPGFLSTLMLIGLVGGGGWLLFKTLSSQAAAATPGTAPPLTPPTDPLAAISALFNSGADVQASTRQGLPLGIANNNPCNIVWSAANNWTGQTGQDANGFCIFSDPVYGLRAAFKLLRTYQGEIERDGGVFDIVSISRQWTRTQQDAWASNVASVSGLGLYDPLDSGNEGQMTALVNGMVVAENGGAYAGYYAGSLDAGFSMAA